MAKDEKSARLGQFIKQRRLEIGLNRVQFEDKFGVNGGYLNNVERGQVTPSLNALTIIAQGIHVRPGLLADIYAGVDQSGAECSSPNCVQLPEILIGQKEDIEDIKEYIEMKADRRFKLKRQKDTNN